MYQSKRLYTLNSHVTCEIYLIFKKEGSQGHEVTSDGIYLGDYPKKMLRNGWKCESEVLNRGVRNSICFPTLS